MNTYTNYQLKAALAKMLPDAIEIFHNKLWWRQAPAQACCAVLDTELLHLCWMVEETFTKDYRVFRDYLDSMTDENMGISDMFIRYSHATWQQRVIALAKVKGVEIV